MQRILILLLLLSATFNLNAQTGLIKGRVLHKESKLPYADVTLTLSGAKVIAVSDGDGAFTFSSIPFGSQDMVLSINGDEVDRITIQVNGPLTVLEDIELETVGSTNNNYTLDNSASNFEEAGGQDDNSLSSGGQNISSVLNAARDAYLSAATFGWGQYFYRMRGYENDHSILFLNGVPMNDLEEGGVFYNAWSGLNDVFRGRTVSLGLAPNESNFGGLGLNTTLDASASNQRRGTRLTYTATNRSYRNRLMLTHSSGLMKNGWAWSVSLSKRWAQQGPIKGTFYDAYGYFGAIEKRFKKHGLSFMVVGAPTRRGKSGPTTKEAFRLAGTNYYNPYWGYQDGKIRNSRVLTSHQPLFILSHDAKLNSRTILNTAVSYQFGETANSGIDWFNAPDPRPDYYRYMPSYLDSADLTAQAEDRIKSDPEAYMQINWDRMYEANRLNKMAGYGRSVYIVNENVEATRKFNAAVNIESAVGDHLTVYAGAFHQSQNNHNFQRVADLLGGDYWENVNQFAARNFGNAANTNLFNVDDKSTVRKVGDTYGYDYNVLFSRTNAFAQGVFTYNRLDFFLSGEAGYTSFHREGNYRHGLYQNNSLGHSEHLNFFTWRGKGGLTYKLNGRHYLYANGAAGNRAPFVDNVVVSARTRNQIISNPRTEQFNSVEAGYLLRSPNIRARLTWFVTNVQHASDIKRYFYADSGAFVNLVMQGIDKRYTGIEAGAEIKISPSFSLNLGGAFTQAFYTSRPKFSVFSDNDTAQLNNVLAGSGDSIFMKNYYVPSGPQTALQASLNYRSKRFWYASLTFNYLARNWIDFSPLARTGEGVDLLQPGSPEFKQVIEQQQLPSFYTVDLFGGKSFKVNKYIKKADPNMFLLMNIGITNALNNRNIHLYGFENLRSAGERDNPDWFAPRYAYALGIQYFLNFSLRF